MLLPIHLQAVCTNSGGGIWTTAGNEASDIRDCITAASTGDTINVVAGDGEADFATAVVINKAVNIVGPGVNNLTITWAAYQQAFNIDLVAAKISGFNFSTTTGRTAIDVRGQGWRIHNCKYTNTSSSTTGLFVMPNGTNTTTEPYGLVDHNEILFGRVVPYGGSNHSSQSAIWNRALNLGTYEAVYIEDNVFTYPQGVATNCVDSNRSGKYVTRYNTITNATIMAHSLQGNEERGTRKWEIYGNKLISDNTTTYAGMFLRGGTGTIMFNDLTSSVAWNISILLDNVRSESYTVDNNTTAEGRCDGDNSYDGNLGQGLGAGWPCRDQIGRSDDAFFWSTSSTLPGPSQASAPVYAFLNRKTAGALVSPYVDTAAANPYHIIKDRDYFTEDTANCPANPSGTCSLGVGYGTLANRPANCVTGTAYWATSQDLSDLTIYSGVDHTASISGTLYKCVSTNTWSVPDDGITYTPYQYPHPLQGTSFVLSVAKAGTGSLLITSDVGGINCGSVCATSIADDTVVTLSQTPVGDTVFDGWSGACSGTGDCVVTMSAARSVTATSHQETPNEWATIINHNGSGTTNPAVGSHVYSEGGAVSITQTPTENWTFNIWSGTCPFDDPYASTATYDQPSGDCTAIANWTANTKYSFTITTPEHGYVYSDIGGIFCGNYEDDCSAELYGDDAPSFTFVPDFGYALTAVGGNFSGLSSPQVVNMNDAAKTGSATFSLMAGKHQLGSGPTVQNGVGSTVQWFE